MKDRRSLCRTGAVCLLAFAVVCVGCSRTGDAPPVLRADESPTAWAVREVARIGAVEGSDEAGLFQAIRGLEVDEQGTVYVLNGSPPTIRVFASDGGYVRSMGRSGQGPGEFKRPIGMVLASDGRLWVADAGNGRYEVFARNGTSVETYRKGIRSGFMTWWGAVATRAGVIYEPHLRVAQADGEWKSAYIGFVPADRITRVLDTIFRAPPEFPPTWSVQARGSSSGITVSGAVPVPFAPSSQDYLDSRRGYWTATTDAFRFVRRSPKGDTLLVVERDIGPPRPVGGSDADLAIESLRRRFGKGLQVERDLIPETMPRWQSFFVDDVGRLWVRLFEPRAGARPGTWEIFDVDGSYLGRLLLPLVDRPAPVVRGNWLVGVVRDDLDVEHAVLYDLGIGGGVP